MCARLNNLLFLLNRNVFYHLNTCNTIDSRICLCISFICLIKVSLCLSWQGRFVNRVIERIPIWTLSRLILTVDKCGKGRVRLRIYFRSFFVFSNQPHWMIFHQLPTCIFCRFSQCIFIRYEIIRTVTDTCSLRLKEILILIGHCSDSIFLIELFI